MPTRDSAHPRPVGFHDDAPRAGRHDFFDGSVAPVVRTAFDVSAYTLEVGGRIPVDAAAIARDARGDDPALPALRRDLAYLHRIESAALTETRTMYSSWTANEARITAFAASWLWERFWWARALREVRAALPVADLGPGHGPGPHGTAGHDRPRPHPQPHPRPRLSPALRARRLYVERALPLVGPVWTALAKERVTAGHMARMAIQEGSLQVALRALAPRLDGIPEARRVIAEISSRRARSVDFFRQEAIARITRSRGEAVTARLVLAVGGDPLRPAGQGLPHEAEARRSIFAAPEARAALHAARHEITRFLPGRGLPSPHRRPRSGDPRGIRP